MCGEFGDPTCQPQSNIKILFHHGIHQSCRDYTGILVPIIPTADKNLEVHKPCLQNLEKPTLPLPMPSALSSRSEVCGMVVLFGVSRNLDLSELSVSVFLFLGL